MSTFLRLRSEGAPALIARVHAELRDADSHRARDNAAATVIQAAFRGSVSRGEVARLSRAAAVIQRAFHAFSSRRRALSLRNARDRDLRRSMYDHAATTVQRVWRGHFSRRVLHDYYARKRYIEEIRARGDAWRQAADDDARAAEVFERAREEDEAAAEFRDITSQLHHLVSTKACRGIYNPPFSEAPEAYGEPIEEHLKRVKPPRAAQRRRAAREFARRTGDASMGNTGNAGNMRDMGNTGDMGNLGDAEDTRGTGAGMNMDLGLDLDRMKKMPAHSGAGPAKSRTKLVATVRPRVKGPFLPPRRLEAKLKKAGKGSLRASEPYVDRVSAQAEEDRLAREVAAWTVGPQFRTSARGELGETNPGSVHAGVPYVPPAQKLTDRGDRPPAGKPPFRSTVTTGGGFDDGDDF